MNAALVKAALAIDAGGTCFKSALVNCEGEIFDGSICQVPVLSQGTKAEIVSAYAETTRQAFKFAQRCGLEIKGIGIATPGPFDYENGICRMKHKFQAIENVPLRDEIYGLEHVSKNMPIVFMQDVHAFLTGEHWAGNVGDADDAAAITLGTGLGFGIMKNGKILDNGRGAPCEVVFNRPCGGGILEDMISRRGMINRYRQVVGNPDLEIDVCDIAERARGGDPQAIRVFQETGEILAQEIREVLSSYEISLVVFGGQISKSFDLFGPAFNESLARPGRSIRAVAGKHIEHSALTGVAKAAFIAMSQPIGLCYENMKLGHRPEAVRERATC